MEAELRQREPGVQPARLAEDLVPETVGVEQLPGADPGLVQPVQEPQRVEFLDRVRERVDPDAELAAKIGLRKPDARIYQMMVETLRVDPKHCVYLDDLGVNLKPARDMGMTTIKVVNAAQAITELEAATGL